MDILHCCWNGTFYSIIYHYDVCDYYCIDGYTSYDASLFHTLRIYSLFVANNGLIYLNYHKWSVTVFNDFVIQILLSHKRFKRYDAMHSM